MKLYAVKKGRNVGVYNSWEECEKQVKGYSGAIYKSFNSEDEAYKYINSCTKVENSTNTDINTGNTVIAYVDGSYDKDTKLCGYGIVLIVGDNVSTFSGIIDDSNTEMRNVTGEIVACKLAMSLASKVSNINKLIINYDYEGLERWANREWEAKKYFTKEYVNCYDMYSKQFNIVFNKIKAHSGDKYNDLADKLAKESIN